jgi:hypothetical protein
VWPWPHDAHRDMLKKITAVTTGLSGKQRGGTDGTELGLTWRLWGCGRRRLQRDQGQPRSPWIQVEKFRRNSPMAPCSSIKTIAHLCLGLREFRVKNRDSPAQISLEPASRPPPPPLPSTWQTQAFRNGELGTSPDASLLLWLLGLFSRPAGSFPWQKVFLFCLLLSMQHISSASLLLCCHFTLPASSLLASPVFLP